MSAKRRAPTGNFGSRSLALENWKRSGGKLASSSREACWHFVQSPKLERQHMTVMREYDRVAQLTTEELKSDILWYRSGQACTPKAIYTPLQLPQKWNYPKLASQTRVAKVDGNSYIASWKRVGDLRSDLRHIQQLEIKKRRLRVLES